MGGVLGGLLPIALGIAISPLPIIAAILMLLSPEARSTSVAFLAGWLTGIVGAVTALTLLSSVLPQGHQDTPAPVQGVLQFVLGLLMLLVAVRQWRQRPRDGAEAELPKWMAAIDTMRPGAAFWLALLLAVVNPKNLLLAVSAGITIGSAGLGAGQIAASILIFTVIAGFTVLAPVLGYLVAADRLQKPLAEARGWLTRENAVIMAVLLVMLGAQLIGKGIANL